MDDIDIDELELIILAKDIRDAINHSTQRNEDPAKVFNILIAATLTYAKKAGAPSRLIKETLDNVFRHVFVWEIVISCR